MYIKDLISAAKENTFFRKVLLTGKLSQLVLMSIPINGDIGMETHEDTDQWLFFVEGNAEAIINGVSQEVNAFDVVLVPAGTEHNFINKGQTDLKLYTVYTPAHHPDGTIDKTKEDAEKREVSY